MLQAIELAKTTGDQVNNQIAEFTKNCGKEKIKFELIEFGISQEIISEELSKMEDSVWIEQYERLI
jgi:SOS response regulatory protein OraA/RecX